MYIYVSVNSELRYSTFTIKLYLILKICFVTTYCNNYI
nr:MAG TPA: hypothetical protein [Caudoviricetes sp.]